MSILTGLTSGSVETPIEIDGNGRLVVEGVVGETGLAGPPGPPGTAGTGSLPSVAARWWAIQNWTTTSTIPTQFEYLAWCSGLGIYVAAGYNASNTNRLATSTNAINWTTRLTYSGSAGAVAYSPALNRIVHAGNNTIYYSNNGTTWTGATVTAAEWRSVAWSPTLQLFVALNWNVAALPSAAYSADGITWTTTTVPSPRNTFHYRIEWASGLNKFITVPYINTTVLQSSDGITWTNAGTIASAQWRNVVWASGPNILVAVASSGILIATSPDGTTWTQRGVPYGGVYNGAIAWSPELGMFLISGSDGGLQVSSDGIIYDNQFAKTNPQNTPNSLQHMIWVPEKFQFAAVSQFLSGTLL